MSVAREAHAAIVAAVDADFDSLIAAEAAAGELPLPRELLRRCLMKAVGLGKLAMVDHFLADARLRPLSELEQWRLWKVAAEAKQVTVVHYLLQRFNADPLHIAGARLVAAAAAGDLHTVDAVLADPVADPAADATVHWAVGEYLLPAGSDVPISEDLGSCSMGNAAIRAATIHTQQEVVDRLLGHPRVDPGSDGSSLLGWAAEYGHRELLERLLADERVDPAARGPLPSSLALTRAVRGGNLPIVERLLADPRVDAAAQSNEALATAMTWRRMEIFERLLDEPRVDVEGMHIFDDVYPTFIAQLVLEHPRFGPGADNSRALLTMIDVDDVEVLRQVLADARVDPGVSRHKLLRDAVEHGRLDIVETLLTDPRIDPLLPCGDVYPDLCDMLWDTASSYRERGLTQRSLFAFDRILLQPAVVRSRLTRGPFASTSYLELPKALQWERSECWDAEARAAGRNMWALTAPGTRSLAALAWRRRCRVVAARERTLAGLDEESDGSA